MFYSQVIKIVLKFPALRRHEFKQALSLYFRVLAKTSDRTSVEQTEGTHHDGGIYETFLSYIFKLPDNSSLATCNGKLKIKTVRCCRTYLGSKPFLEPL